jgi:hypothetical protein
VPTSEELHKRRTAAVARGVGSVVASYVDRAGGGPACTTLERGLDILEGAFDQTR